MTGFSLDAFINAAARQARWRLNTNPCRAKIRLLRQSDGSQSRGYRGSLISHFAELLTCNAAAALGAVLGWSMSKRSRWCQHRCGCWCRGHRGRSCRCSCGSHCRCGSRGRSCSHCSCCGRRRSRCWSSDLELERAYARKPASATAGRIVFVRVPESDAVESGASRLRIRNSTN